MRYQAIIFDLDGTLIDSLADIAAATNRTMSAHGFPTHPIEAYRNFIGDGVRKLIVRALPEPMRTDEAIVAKCLETYGRDYGSSWNVKTCLYPGMAGALSELSRMGLKLAVLSNKPDEFTQSCAAQFLAQWRFDLVMGASPRFPHKPDPSSALEIARRFELSPAEFLYVGDMPVDMQTARNAGMRAIGVSWGLRSREQLVEAGADRVIDSPGELATIAREERS